MIINFIKQSALVLILSVVFGSALALIYAKTNPLYKANQEKATLVSIAKTIPGAKEAQNLKTSEVESIEEYQVYRVFDSPKDGQEKLLGWAYVAKGKGFSGDIKLLIGLNAQADSLVGIDVLEDVETPGFGNYINDEERWKSKFRPSEDGTTLSLERKLVVVKTTPNKPYKIQAITGATISSKAVVAIINDSAAKVAAQVKQED